MAGGIQISGGIGGVGFRRYLRLLTGGFIVLFLGLGIQPFKNIAYFQAFAENDPPPENDPQRLSRAEKRRKKREERERLRAELDARSQAGKESLHFAGGNSDVSNPEKEQPKPPSPGEIERRQRFAEKQSRAERRNKQLREALDTKAQLEIQVRQLRQQLSAFQDNGTSNGEHNSNGRNGAKNHKGQGSTNHLPKTNGKGISEATPPAPVDGPFSPNTHVNQFISETLKKDPLLFNPSLKRADEIKAGLILSEKISKDSTFNPLNDDTLAAIEKSGFADSSLEDLAKVFRILGHTNYNCSLLVGEPGVGKSFTLEQVVYMLSFGVMPKTLQEKIGLEFGADKSPYYKLFPAIHEAFVGKTQIITVNSILLSFDNTPPGQAWAKAVDRAKHVLMELFEKAEKDFREHKIRTLFVMEEMAQFDEHLFDTIKILFDRTGFKTISDDPLVRGKDPGFSIMGLTTFKERDLLFQNVKALPIARRMHNIEKHEPPIEEVIKIAKKKAEMLFYTHGILLEDGVIEYLIHKAKLLFNQPEAMPGSILKSMDNLVGWASDKRKLQNPGSGTVSLYDVNKFFITEVMKLPSDLWLPSETNPVPFINLAEFIAQGFVDHPYIKAIDKVSWQMRDTINRGFDVLPFFIIGGPTGAGKNTLVSRLSLGVFGHDSDGLRISIAGMDEEDIRRLFEGSPNSSEMPEVFTRIQRNPNGFIILDEAADAKPGALNYLKVLLDKRGRVQPKTPGAREYILGYHGIVLTGQFGQEFFDQLTTDRQIDDMLYDLGEKISRQVLLQGKYTSSNEGGLDPAIIDRSIKDGAAIVLPPVSKSEYPEIISRQMEKVLIPLHKAQMGFDLSFDRDFVNLVDEINANVGSKTRELEGITSKIIGRSLVVLNELGAEKTPTTGAKIHFSADLKQGILVVKLKNPGQSRWKTVSIQPNKIMVIDCKLHLQSTLVDIPKNPQ